MESCLATTADERQGCRKSSKSAEYRRGRTGRPGLQVFVSRPVVPR